MIQVRSLARSPGDPVAAYEALSFGESSCYLSYLLNGVESVPHVLISYVSFTDRLGDIYDLNRFWSRRTKSQNWTSVIMHAWKR